MKKESLNATQTKEKCPHCQTPMLLTEESDGAGHRMYFCQKCKISKLYTG